MKDLFAILMIVFFALLTLAGLSAITLTTYIIYQEYVDVPKCIEPSQMTKVDRDKYIIKNQDFEIICLPGWIDEYGSFRKATNADVNRKIFEARHLFVYLILTSITVLFAFATQASFKVYNDAQRRARVS